MPETPLVKDHADQAHLPQSSWAVGFASVLFLMLAMGLVMWLSQALVFAAVSKIAQWLPSPRFDVFKSVLFVMAMMAWSLWIGYWVMLPTSRNILSRSRIGLLGLDYRGIEPSEVKGAVIGWFPGLAALIRFLKPAAMLETPLVDDYPTLWR